MKTLLILLTFLLPSVLYCQSPCRGSNTNYYFNSNNIGATFNTSGGKFYIEDGVSFQVPHPGPNHVNIIRASSPWIGAIVDNLMHIAAQTYTGLNNFDFTPGPLGPGATIYSDLCIEFDTIWRVYREEILKHIFDFLQDGEIDYPVASVFGWPAEGNPYFQNIHGFELPENHIGGWADYFDINNNHIYEPQMGEYPVVKMKNKYYIPDQILWQTFNDQGYHLQSNGKQLGIEIQLTAFGFNCTDNGLLGNSLFNTYKIINQSDKTIDSLFFGMFAAYRLGCEPDDFIGCDTTRNAVFVYNGDEVDGDDGNDCSSGSVTYGPYPPALSMSYISHPLNSFIAFNRMINSSHEYYRALTGRWRDNTPITAFDWGYNPGVSEGITKFLFYGDPRDSTQWHQQDRLPIHQYDPLYTVSSINLGRLQPSQVVLAETIYMFHQDSMLNNLEHIGLMHSDIGELNIMLNDVYAFCTSPLPCFDGDCIWPGDINHNGIADHYDLLYWGVMQDQSGSARKGLTSWRGHYGEDWSQSTVHGVNFKHGDADGNGLINFDDLERNTKHFLFTHDHYVPDNQYPVGPEILLTSDPINASGGISRFSITTNVDLDQIHGLAYELEFDTSLFEMHSMNMTWPGDSNSVMYWESGNKYFSNNSFLVKQQKFAAVNADHKESFIPKNSVLQKSLLNHAFSLKPGLTLYDIPPTTTFRLRNLIAIDSEGNNLHIGANHLTLNSPLVTGATDYEKIQVNIYPNPAFDYIIIEGYSNAICELVNIQGQLVEKIILRSNKIDLSAFPSGLYLLRLPELGRTFKVVVY